MQRRTDSLQGGQTRRAVLASMGTSSTFLLAGCLGDGGGNGGDGDEGPIRIGVSVPDSGNRTTEGEQLRDGYELAAANINNGEGAISAEPWGDISNAGKVLDREIELVFEDSGGTKSGANSAANSLAGDVDVLTGGATIGEGLAHQEVAAQEELVYMGGFVPTDEVAGNACNQYSFNEMYNPKIAAESLAGVVADELGEDSIVDFMQMYLDTDFGDEFSRTFKDRFKAIGPEWAQIRRDKANVDQRSYEDTINGVLGTDPDLVILNIYGRDGVNAIRDFGDLAPDDLPVVVPIIGPQIAKEAGSALEDVFGTVHWLPGLTGFSSEFEAAWDGDRSTDNPTQMANLAYVQLCQYAAAVERAGSTDTSSVISELEGRQYDLGLGSEILRECDHQAMRHAPVVQGLPESQQSPGNYYELAVSIRDAATDPPYSCDNLPAFNCDLS